MAKRCFPFSHKWNNWQFTGRWVAAYHLCFDIFFAESQFPTSFRQERHCDRCGKVGRRWIEVNDYDEMDDLVQTLRHAVPRGAADRNKLTTRPADLLDLIRASDEATVRKIIREAVYMNQLPTRPADLLDLIRESDEVTARNIILRSGYLLQTHYDALTQFDYEAAIDFIYEQRDACAPRHSVIDRLLEVPVLGPVVAVLGVIVLGLWVLIWPQKNGI